MREDEVTIGNGDVRLAGTLTRPDDDGPCPVVLCLHGSGPLDRNENLRVQRLDVFNTLAADLARRGIATLRYDKRGCGRSSGDYYRAGHVELMADAEACLAFLAVDARFTARFALGHSEGTIMAARLSLSHTDLAGLVLLSPFIEPLGAMLLDQADKMEQMLRTRPGLAGALNRFLMRFLGTPRASQGKLLARLRESDAPVVRQGLQRVPAKWLREVIALDPAAIYAEVRVPSLVLGGGKDLQCNPADVGRIAAVLGERATPVLIGDLTHLLRRDPGPASFAAYPKLLRQPMDAEVVGIVGEWLAAQTASR